MCVLSADASSHGVVEVFGLRRVRGHGRLRHLARGRLVPVPRADDDRGVPGVPHTRPAKVAEAHEWAGDAIHGAELVKQTSRLKQHGIYQMHVRASAGCIKRSIQIIWIRIFGIIDIFGVRWIPVIPSNGSRRAMSRNIRSVFFSIFIGRVMNRSGAISMRCKRRFEKWFWARNN